MSFYREALQAAQTARARIARRCRNTPFHLVRLVRGESQQAEASPVAHCCSTHIAARTSDEAHPLSNFARQDESAPRPDEP